MSVHFRTMLPPGASKKRKEVEPFCSVKPLPLPTAEPFHSVKPLADSKADDSVTPNWLLAGYLASEFLNRGTLLGEKYDPARSEAVRFAHPPVECSSSSKRTKLDGGAPSLKMQNQSYAEVAEVLKMDGAHLPGVVNPTQLARWIKM